MKRAYGKTRKQGKSGLQLTLEPETVLAWMRDEVRDLALEAGMAVVGALLADEVERLCGPPYSRRPDSTLRRHGQQPGCVAMAGQKLRLDKPRVRDKDGGEVSLPRYRLLQQADAMDEAALRRMVRGVSTRDYEAVVDTVSESYGVKKSSVSRNFVRASAVQLQTLCERRWGNERFAAIFVDGKAFANEMLVVALGVTDGGEKRVLGLRQGATENAAVATALLEDLASRGVRTDLPTLFVLDGSKALASAVRKTWGGNARIQRCRVHKRRNVEAHLAEKHHAALGERLGTAWNEPDAEKAMRSLQTTAAWLERLNPDAASSLREGMAETLAVTRLGVTGPLLKTLSTTNPIESTFSVAASTTGRVKRWRDGNMRLRWCAAGLLKAEQRFRRVRGYREIPLLLRALERETQTPTVDTARQAA